MDLAGTPGGSQKQPGVSFFSFQTALRLAVVEIALGGAAHGAVNAAVEIVRRGKRTGHLAGLVNAVLRKVPEVPFAGLPPQRMPCRRARGI